MSQSAISRDLQFLRNQPRAMRALMDTHRAAMKTLGATRDYYTPADYERRVQAQRDEYTRQRNQLAQACRAAKQRLEDIAAIASGEGGRTENTARAFTTAAAWARMRIILEHQSDPHAVVARARQFIGDAAKTGDTATLRALREELPSWIEATMPHAVAQSLIGALQAETMQAGGAYMTPEERLGWEIQQALRPYGQAIEGNLGRLEASAANTQQALIGLIDWDGSYLPSPEADAHDAQPQVARFTLSDTDPETGAPIPGSK